MAEFLRHDRADTCKMAVESFPHWLRCLRHHCGHFLLASFQRIQFAGRLGNEVFPAWKYLPDRADLGGNVLNAVDDHSLAGTENNIAVLSHQLHNQPFPAEISHLVQMLDFKLHRPLQTWLGDGNNFSVSNVLSQQHTEIRRSQRAVFVFVCQVSQRKAGVDR